MASQDEYLRNFIVVETEHDLIVVSDPMQITIFNTIGDTPIRPNDLASVLDIPSSSLHFSLEKMMESGILKRFKSDEDKKSVYYATNGRIVVKTESNNIPYSEIEKIYKSIGFSDLNIEAFARILALYAFEIGIDLKPLLRGYATDYARYTSRQLPKGKLEDVIFDIRKKFSEVCPGTSFSTFGLTPLTLIFTGDSDHKKYIEAYSILVCTWISICTGKGYSIESIEPISGDNSRIKVVFQRTPDNPTDKLQSTEIEPMKIPAMAIVTGGIIGIITSEVQISILRALAERPLCITDIINQTKTPRSTAVSNILRMLEDGVLNAYTNEAGVAYYGLNCQVILDRTDLTHMNPEHLLETMQRIDEKYKFVGGLGVAITDIFESFGLDTTGLSTHSGARYARSHSSELTNFNSQLEISTKMAAGMGVKLTLENTCPLTYSITPLDNETIKFRAGFLIGFIHQCLMNNSDSLYSRTISKNGNSYKVTFREVYPALKPSNPDYSDLSNKEPVSTTKRSSSLEMALRKRSTKAKNKNESSNIARILSVALLLVCVAAISAFIITPTTTMYEVDATNLQGYGVTDEQGNPIESNFTMAEGEKINIYCSKDITIGYVSDGIAVPLLSKFEGEFTITAYQNFTLAPVYCIEMPNLEDANIKIYNFSGEKVYADDIQALLFENYIDFDKYPTSKNYLWVTDNLIVLVESLNGSLIKPITDGEAAMKVAVFEKDEITYIEIISDKNYTCVNDNMDMENDNRWCRGGLYYDSNYADNTSNTLSPIF